jgi:hypothetical protein
MNLYGFVGNEPIGSIDGIGLARGTGGGNVIPEIAIEYVQPAAPLTLLQRIFQDQATDIDMAILGHLDRGRGRELHMPISSLNLAVELDDFEEGRQAIREVCRTGIPQPIETSESLQSGYWTINWITLATRGTLTRACITTPNETMEWRWCYSGTVSQPVPEPINFDHFLSNRGRDEHIANIGGFLYTVFTPARPFNLILTGDVDIEDSGPIEDSQPCE